MMTPPSYNTGLLCDLLWADPDKETMGWGENDRGVSFTFGPEIVSKFLTMHGLDLICRGHQVRVCGWCGSTHSLPPPSPPLPSLPPPSLKVVEDGYEFFAKKQLVTLFSAPNYRGEFDNGAAIMSVDETLLCSFQVCRVTALHTWPDCGLDIPDYEASTG